MATARLGSSAPPREVLGGVEIWRFPGPALLDRWLVPYASRLRAFLRERLASFDVVHVHGHRNGLAVAAASLTGGYVLQPSGTFPDHGQHRLVKRVFDGLWGDRVVARASTLLAVSEAEARDLPRPAAVVPNGVEPCGTARPRPARARPRLLFVGNDRPQKRAHRLAALLEALPDVELQLVGPIGPALLRHLAGLGDRVRAVGVLAGDELASAYAGADLVVHPAVGEAFGLVPFEAALAGTASVVAGGHGCGEWFSRAGGCVVPPDDGPALLAAVRERLGDPARARDEARAVAGFAREHLTWDRAAQSVESIYEQVRR